jgi:hypothetical protein
VAAQLAGFQEGRSSMSEVNAHYKIEHTTMLFNLLLVAPINEQ